LIVDNKFLSIGSPTYSRAKRKIAMLEADLCEALARAEAASADTAQVKLEMTNKANIAHEQHYMAKCQELHQLSTAYEASVEMVAALTKATLDQTVEIFR
jgi:hypothetical protein